MQFEATFDHEQKSLFFVPCLMKVPMHKLDYWYGGYKQLR